jgi:hypothetical protein
VDGDWMRASTSGGRLVNELIGLRGLLTQSPVGLLE